MGTRNLTMVVADKKYVVTQYGQWDGYPSGQGRTALDFCRKRLTTKMGREAFRSKLRHVRDVSDAELKSLWEEVGADRWRQVYPTLSRDTGAEVLGIIWSSKGEVLHRPDFDFIRDSLMCEWAYVIDLDKNTFEVFKGFNEKPLPKKDRFAHLAVREREYSGGTQYYPCRCVAKFSLDDLPPAREFEKLGQEDDDE